MIFRTPISVTPSVNKISHEDNIFCIGSCFAQNISVYFEKYRFSVAVNPLGVMFNPASIVKTFDRIINKRLFTADDLIFNPAQDVWLTTDAHSQFNGFCKEEVLGKLNLAIEKSHNDFIKSSVVVITLGTTWVYENSAGVVANCHKLPASGFSRRAMSVDDVTTELSSLIFSDAFSEKRVIITVSPVRHLKDGFTENSFSKSTLICAVHSVCREYSAAEYFPSYEIVMDDLRDYRFYDTDMIHPSPLAVEYIWRQFSECYMSKQTLDIMPEIERVNRSISHRPFNPDSELYKKHIENTDLKKENINKKVNRKIF